MDLAAIVERLRMVAMDFVNRAGPNVFGEQFPPAADRKFDVGEAALVAAASSVANDDRQYVDRQMVPFRPGNRAAQSKPPITTTDIDDDGRGTPKQLHPVDRAAGRI